MLWPISLEYGAGGVLSIYVSRNQGDCPGSSTLLGLVYG
jgi:hypothetical protein